jgi:thioredoxin 1
LIRDITIKELDSMISSDDKLIIVEFYTPGCSPCQAVSRTLEEIRTEIEANMLKMDLNQNYEAIEKYKIETAPTVMLFQNKKCIGSIQGMALKYDILHLIEYSNK